VDNQHRKIIGYRELNEDDISLMNQVKALGPEIEAVVRRVEARITEQHANAKGNEVARLTDADPDAWLREGKLHLQQGLMFLTRAVAQPDFF
jgi:hypothetical protein